MKTVPFDPAQLDPKFITQRRMRVATLVLAFTAPAALGLADLHWQSGYDLWKLVHLALFTGLFLLLAFGAAQAIVGFAMRRKGGDPCQIMHSLEGTAKDADIQSAPTAIVMPICNEDVDRVRAGFRAIYESVVATGKLSNCDFFLLSDSTDPNVWIEEEAAWLALTQELGAQGKIFYRKRRVGINKKAGNLADFCRRWGRHYRYMVVLDADSLITGDAVVDLVRLMERNPTVGIVQAVPQLVNGETILARVQQFASRLYGTVFSTGLNYWQLGEGNYWGHNAIIRLAPFVKHCSLPELPGDGPFGGRIMSHDYVEAALMRRAGWQVWLATGLEGNYEECPATLVDFAKRDRRWLQGNLQHSRLIYARGFHTVNRLHFVLGIMSYVSSPLWAVFLLISAIIAYRVPSDAAGKPLALGLDGHLPWGYTTQAVGLFVLTLILLFLPKVLAILDLRRQPGGLERFGGTGKIVAGILVETFTFTLLAPILMVYHTKFVILTLCRQSIGWKSQRRGGTGDWPIREAVEAHLGHTILGIVAAFVIMSISPAMTLWMAPLLVGLILSIPISLATGHVSWGLALRRKGILQTPDEAAPDPVLQQTEQHLAALRVDRAPNPQLASDYGLVQAVLDPFVNAVHVSLLRAKDDTPPASEERFAALRTKLLREGPSALAPRDRLALLMDLDSMTALHHELWATPTASLAEWWRAALEHYKVVVPPPQTALTR